MHPQYLRELIEFIKRRKPSKNDIAGRKLALCSKYKIKDIPTDIEILLSAPEHELPRIRRLLLAKPTRTASGVAVVAAMAKPRRCPHGRCITCPGGPGSEFGNVPQSYTGKEPATRRAIRNHYDPYLQVMNRLEQYVAQGHLPSKVELIIMGGTFPSYPRHYRDEFVRCMLKALNDFSKVFFRKEGGRKARQGKASMENSQLDIAAFKKFFELPGDIFSDSRIDAVQAKLLRLKQKSFAGTGSTLEAEQRRNEISNIKCVAMCIETRPDYAMLKHANDMLRLGATRVEIGVQSTDNNVLKAMGRGHSVQDSVEATRILKDLGFKVGYHIMLGLPGASNELKSLKLLFKSEDFQPDMLKIYPCMVLKGTKLYSMWKAGNYKPLTTMQAARLIVRFKRIVPGYCRISRVQRDIPTFMTEAGVGRTNLRQYITAMMGSEKCRCIRCSEIGIEELPKHFKYAIDSVHYLGSGGNEFFIAAVWNGRLLGYCRLRFPAQQLRSEITQDSALLRELHVLGLSAGIGERGSVQHRGIGKALMAEAERLARTYYKRKIVVISGIGARGYYRKLGYRREGVYMVKNI